MYNVCAVLYKQDFWPLHWCLSMLVLIIIDEDLLESRPIPRSVSGNRRCQQKIKSSAAHREDICLHSNRNDGTFTFEWYWVHQHCTLEKSRALLTSSVVGICQIQQCNIRLLKYVNLSTQNLSSWRFQKVNVVLWESNFLQQPKSKARQFRSLEHWVLLWTARQLLHCACVILVWCL